jgi:tetratricopeptide (TPR) repeat protein
MQNKIVTFAFVALLGLGSMSCAKLEARDDLQKGATAFKAGKYEAAVSFFQEAARLDPDLTVAEVFLGTSYEQQYIPGAQSEDNMKFANMAIKTFEDILTKDPKNVSAVAGLAGIYYNMGDIRKAREYYVKHSQLDPTNPIPFYEIGTADWIIVFDKNNPPPEDEQRTLVDEGLKSVDQAIVLNPDYDDAMAYKNLLLREKARLTDNEDEKKQLIAQADDMFTKVLEARKRIAAKKASLAGTADNKQ